MPIQPSDNLVHICFEVRSYFTTANFGWEIKNSTFLLTAE